MSRLTSVTLRSLVSGICALRTNGRRTLPTRSYCQNASPAKPNGTNDEASAGYRLFLSEKRPTTFEKKVLLWAGRFKKQEDIPKFVPCEAIAAAKSNIRIKVCMAMILLTVIGCILMVRSGKKAHREKKTLLQRNMQKKAKWREEAARERSDSLKSH